MFSIEPLKKKQTGEEILVSRWSLLTINQSAHANKYFLITLSRLSKQITAEFEAKCSFWYLVRHFTDVDQF